MSQLLRVLALVAAGLMLSACAQSALMQKADLAQPEEAKTSAGPAKPAPDRPASYGLASYYSEGHATASGERFDPRQMTAAHRSLPFGTKLRVTNVKSGHSVVVRVNDRGPFVHGRLVDVSYAAAREIDLVGAGTAKVKVEVLDN
jgi:peptidoglycan lytic transglycosylase